MSIVIACSDFGVPAREAFVAGIAAAIQVDAGHVFLDDVSCDQQQPQPRRLGFSGGREKTSRQKSSFATPGLPRNLGLPTQGRRTTEGHRHGRRLQDTPAVSLISRVTLSVTETQAHGGLDGAILELQDQFEDETFRLAMEAAGEDVGEKDLSDAFGESVVDVESIYDQNHMHQSGDNDAFKGIIFLTFVVCLTLFVAIVLSIVIWLEYQKCQTKDSYNEF
jgi:hypothetical protein